MTTYDLDSLHHFKIRDQPEYIYQYRIHVYPETIIIGDLFQDISDEEEVVDMAIHWRWKHREKQESEQGNFSNLFKFQD